MNTFSVGQIIPFTWPREEAALAPTIRMVRQADGYALDFNDKAFKNSAWTTQYLTLTPSGDYWIGSLNTTGMSATNTVVEMTVDGEVLRDEYNIVAAGTQGATLTEIEGSLVIAKEASVQTLLTRVTAVRAGLLDNLDTLLSTAFSSLTSAVGTPMQAGSYVAPDNAGISTLTSRLSAVRAGLLDNLDTMLSTAFSALTGAVGSPLQAGSYTAPDNAGIGTLLSRVTATRAGLLDNLDTVLSTAFAAIASAVGTPMQAGSYTAPDNAGISAIAAAMGTPMQAGSYVAPDNAGISTLTTRLSAIRAGLLDNLNVVLSTAFASLTSAVGTPMQAGSYVAPDNAGVAAVASALADPTNGLAAIKTAVAASGGVTLQQIENSLVLAKAQALSDLSETVNTIATQGVAVDLTPVTNLVWNANPVDHNYPAGLMQLRNTFHAPGFSGYALCPANCNVMTYTGSLFNGARIELWEVNMGATGGWVIGEQISVLDDRGTTTVKGNVNSHLLALRLVGPEPEGNIEKGYLYWQVDRLGIGYVTYMFPIPFMSRGADQYVIPLSDGSFISLDAGMFAGLGTTCPANGITDIHHQVIIHGTVDVIARLNNAMDGLSALKAAIQAGGGGGGDAADMLAELTEIAAGASLPQQL
jgi:Flp pilus assembly pilin Flp